jgi:hypothetical protein
LNNVGLNYSKRRNQISGSYRKGQNGGARFRSSRSEDEDTSSGHMYVPGPRNSGPAYPETEKYEPNTFGHNE